VGGITNIRTSRFSIVDLAGSERQRMVGTAGERLKEGCLINKSLSVLANVINSLVDISEGKSRFIHYRDSKLTFLLKDSLGGNSKTSIIANISPASSSFAETLSTLKFAQRAKLIKNKVCINEDSTGTLDSLKNEIKRLRQELASVRGMLNFGDLTSFDDKKMFNLVPNSSNSLFGAPDQIKYFQENAENNRSLELEILLKQSLEILTESELHLHNELSKKEEIIEKLKNAYQIYDKNELQMRMIIKLLEDKVERYRSLLNQKLTKEDIMDLVDEERESIKKENEALLEIVTSTPTLMKLFTENLNMKEKLDSIEDSKGEKGNTIVKQLQDNIGFLQEISKKIDVSA